MPDENSLSAQAAPAAPRPAVADGPSSAVSAFVADAINVQRRSDGLSRLLADLAAGEQPTGSSAGDSSRDVLEVC